MSKERRMTKPGRLPCINKTCKRTGAQDKHPGSTEIICAKCFRSMPTLMRARHKQLWKRSDKLDRLTEKHREDPAMMARINRNYELLESVWQSSYRDMWCYFNQQRKPEGLDNFLEEMGMKE